MFLVCDTADGLKRWCDDMKLVHCWECKKRNTKKCPLVMVRFNVMPNGRIKEVLEQNHVDGEFYCKSGERKGGE